MQTTYDFLWSMKQNSLTFQVLLIPEQEGGYSALVPALPGCVSQGETIEETRINITEAIELYVETLAEMEIKNATSFPDVVTFDITVHPSKVAHA